MLYLLAAFVFALLTALANWKSIRPLLFIAKPAVLILLFIYLWTSTGLEGATFWFGVNVTGPSSARTSMRIASLVAGSSGMNAPNENAPDDGATPRHVATTVDASPQARYFQQSKNGLFVRMALLLMMLDAAGTGPHHRDSARTVDAEESHAMGGAIDGDR